MKIEIVDSFWSITSPLSLREKVAEGRMRGVWGWIQVLSLTLTLV
jgi:hypothetical protein